MSKAIPSKPTTLPRPTTPPKPQAPRPQPQPQPKRRDLPPLSAPGTRDMPKGDPPLMK